MRTSARTGELLQGTLDMLVLKTLAHGAMHGYAIAEFIEQRTENILRVEEGALYPALHRLKRRGWLQSEAGLSEKKRRAKYYRLTEAGCKQLAEENVRWDRITLAIAKIMNDP